MKLAPIIIGFFSLFSIQSLVAQNYWNWVQDGGLLDESYDFIPTSDNGYIGCGTINTDFEQDTYIIKFDESGNVQWEKTIDTNNGGLYEIAVKIIELDNHYYIAVSGSSSNLYADILKLNLDGDQMGSFRASGFDISNLHPTQDGNIYAFYNNVFDGLNFLVNYDTDLMENWVVSLPNTTFNIIESHSFVNRNGNFQLVSHKEGANPSTIEVDQNGSIIKNLTAVDDIALLGENVMSHDLDDNRLVLVGAGRIGVDNDGIRIVDENLSNLQSISLSNEFYDARAIDVFDENIYVAGRSAEDFSFSRICIYSAEPRLTKVIDLSFINDAVPDVQTSFIESIHLNDKSEIFITGFLQVDFVTSGRFFAYLNKVGGLNDVSYVEILDNEFELSLYPNPAHDKLFISSDMSLDKAYYSIHNQSGQISQKGQMGSEIDIAKLIPGIYSIIVNTADKQVTRSFLKE